MVRHFVIVALPFVWVVCLLFGWVVVLSYGIPYYRRGWGRIWLRDFGYLVFLTVFGGACIIGLLLVT